MIRRVVVPIQKSEELKTKVAKNRKNAIPSCRLHYHFAHGGQLPKTSPLLAVVVVSFPKWFRFHSRQEFNPKKGFQRQEFSINSVANFFPKYQLRRRVIYKSLANMLPQTWNFSATQHNNPHTMEEDWTEEGSLNQRFNRWRRGE